MNEYLEQLVRALTNAYSRSQRMFGERISPGPANQRSFPGLPCCWGQLLIKRHPLIHLSDYALSHSPSACFLCTRFMMSFAKDKGQLQTPWFYSLCPKWATPTANFWAQIILDPYRRPLTLTFLLVSTRGLFQDMMFERLHDSTFSEDASKVVMQPLPCGTEKANSVARVVVKLTPRLCNRCASYT